MHVPDPAVGSSAPDRADFQRLTQPYHRELRVHCYRMLGSFHDADDALQDTLLAAWQHLSGFEDRASLRTWLYRIATNKCLDARRSAIRRAAREWNVPGVRPPEPTRLGEVTWLEPIPDSWWTGITETSLGPAARYDQREAISLAFVTALQLLPPRQVAALVLRDVLGFPAAEVAEMLDCTVEAVTSALKRARAGLRRGRAADPGRGISPGPGSRAEQAVLGRFVRAWESADVEALVSVLSHDVLMTMPPIPFEYVGTERVAEFCGRLFAAGRRFRLVSTRANGQPAFGAYLRTEREVGDGVGVYVLRVAGGRITDLTRFEHTMLPVFGLPDRWAGPIPPSSSAGTVRE